MVRAMVGGVAPEEQAEMPVRVTVQASGNDKGLTVDHLSAESQRGAYGTSPCTLLPENKLV